MHGVHEAPLDPRSLKIISFSRKTLRQTKTSYLHPIWHDANVTISGLIIFNRVCPCYYFYGFPIALRGSVGETNTFSPHLLCNISSIYYITLHFVAKKATSCKAWTLGFIPDRTKLWDDLQKKRYTSMAFLQFTHKEQPKLSCGTEYVGWTSLGQNWGSLEIEKRLVSLVSESE